MDKAVEEVALPAGLHSISEALQQEKVSSVRVAQSLQEEVLEEALQLAVHLYTEI